MDLNDELFQRAQISIPGGVNSPVRAFRSVGGSPRFIDRAKGPYMWDATGKQFIDYILSWGPMILGHNNDEVIAAVDEAVSKGLSFGAVTQGETLIAEEVRKLVPSMDQVRLVSSGTEAGMSASPAATRVATRSSSSRAATTATPTLSSSRRAPACSPSAIRPRPVFPPP